MFANELLTTVEKGKPIPAPRHPEIFSCHSLSQKQTMGTLKKQCTVFCFVFTFPVTLGGQEREQFKGESTETDILGEFNIFTRVLKEIRYPDLSPNSSFYYLLCNLLVIFQQQYKATTEGPYPHHFHMYVRPQDAPKTPRFLFPL